MRKNGIILVIAGLTQKESHNSIFGIQRQATCLGYDTAIVSLLAYNRLLEKNEEKIYDIIDFNQYDGVIYLERSFSAFKHVGFNIESMIVAGCNKPILIYGEALPEFEHLKPSAAYSTLEGLTDHLIEEHGCKSILCLGGNISDSDIRIEGYISSMERHGLDHTDMILYGGFWRECSVKLVNEICDKTRELPDAVVCYNSTIAAQLISELSKKGFNVPNDIRVAGYGEYHTWPSPISICCTKDNRFYYYEEAVCRLHEMITGKSAEPVDEPVFEVKPGRSCGCNEYDSMNLAEECEKFENYDLYNMYYDNSGLSALLYTAETQADFILRLEDLLYIIPDIAVFALNIFADNERLITDCVFCKKLSGYERPFRCASSEVIKRLCESEGIAKNYFSVPLIFAEKMYGFITIGYDKPGSFGYNFKRFVKTVSIGWYLLKERTTHCVPTESAVKIPTAAPPTATAPSPAEPPAEAASQSAAQSSKYVFVIRNDAMHKLDFSLICYFEAVGKKVFATTKSGSYEIKKRIYELEDALVASGFARASKNTLVNLSKVVSVKQEHDRSLTLVLSTGQNVRASRTYAKELINVLAL